MLCYNNSWSAVKSLLNDLESLLEDARAALQTANEHFSPLLDKEPVDGLDLQESSGEVSFVLQLFLFIPKYMISCFFTLFIFHSMQTFSFYLLLWLMSI